MKKSILLPFLMPILLLSYAAPAFAGLGISPSDWIEPHSLAGQAMTKTFMLSRSDTEADLYFTTEITGDIMPWITINNGASLMIAKGERELPVNVTVTIPADAAFKEYKGEIRLRSQSNVAKSGTAPVGIVLSSLIQIDLHVSDQPFSDFQVLQITIPDQKVTGFLNVILKIWNQGNTVARPTKLTMDIFDKYNTTSLGSKSFSDFASLAGVAPFSEGSITVKIPVELTPEQYWAKTNVYLDANILKSDDITFNIVDKLSPNAAGTGSERNRTIMLIGGGILLASLVGLGVYLARHKHKSKRHVVRHRAKHATATSSDAATETTIEAATEVPSDDNNVGTMV